MSMPRLPLVAGLCLVCAGLYGCGQSSESARQIAALTNQVAVLKLQAQATRDWTSIANLQASYGFYLDTKRWDDAADLFARQATLEIEGPGLLEGQDNIRAYLRGLGEVERRCPIPTGESAGDPYRTRGIYCQGSLARL